MLSTLPIWQTRWEFSLLSRAVGVTSSNGMDTIDAINGNPNLTPLIAGDPRGAAIIPLLPGGPRDDLNGLGLSSENSAFNRSAADTSTPGSRLPGDTFQCIFGT